MTARGRSWQAQRFIRHSGAVSAEVTHPAVREALRELGLAYEVVACDPALADTAAFCEAYGFDVADAANCIVVASRRPAGEFLVALVLATTRLDVNGRCCELMGVRRASFAPPEQTAELTGMEIGGVTPFGLPAALLPVRVDAAVLGRERVVVGGGDRSAKLVVDPGRLRHGARLRGRRGPGDRLPLPSRPPRPDRRRPPPSLQSVAMPRLELVECSLRAGQQALLLSRLRSRHAVPVARALDGCGFAALDVFGGSTYEAALRFLGEDPFEQLRAIREAAPSSTLVASLGGQALTGHRHVGDDVVDAFIRVAADAGIDRFRIHDPLNDVRNVRRAMESARAAGRQVEAAIVYADSPRHDPDRVVALAEELAAIGADAICIHDPLGLLGIARIGDLVQRVIEATGLPLALSLSTQTGQAEFAAYAASVAGASRLDVALAPLAGGASVPAAEAVIAALLGTELDTGVDLEPVTAASLVLEHQLVPYDAVFDVPALRVDSAALRGLLPPPRWATRSPSCASATRSTASTMSRTRRVACARSSVTPRW